MKAGDLRPCALCGQGVMHTGVPLFWEVRLQRMGVDLEASRQLAGMETFFGHVALARVFTDPEIAKAFGEPRTILVCERCAGEQTSVYQLGLPEGGKE
jgi:hypothetical protein